MNASKIWNIIFLIALVITVNNHPARASQIEVTMENSDSQAHYFGAERENGSVVDPENAFDGNWDTYAQVTSNGQGLGVIYYFEEDWQVPCGISNLNFNYKMEASNVYQNSLYVQLWNFSTGAWDNVVLIEDTTGLHEDSVGVSAVYVNGAGQFKSRILVTSKHSTSAWCRLYETSITFQQETTTQENSDSHTVYIDPISSSGPLTDPELAFDGDWGTYAQVTSDGDGILGTLYHFEETWTVPYGASNPNFNYKMEASNVYQNSLYIQFWHWQNGTWDFALLLEDETGLFHNSIPISAEYIDDNGQIKSKIMLVSKHSTSAWTRLYETSIEYILGCAIEMLPIPGGEFAMGDHFTEGDSFELPVHDVYVSPFRMGKFEITNRQYCLYLNSAMFQNRIKVLGGRVYDIGAIGTGEPYFSTNGYDVDSSISYDGSEFQVINRNNHPVVEVSWFGAAAYCNWLSVREGYQSCYNLTSWECDFSKNGYRLPTEAEWEYATRGNLVGNRYPWGDSIAANQANFWQSGDPYELGTIATPGTLPWNTPVGFYDGSLQLKSKFNWPNIDSSYQTTSGMNAYGLHDMAGNVSEWCNDWYSELYYGSSPYCNPTGPANGVYRVIRSGGWNHDVSYFRASARQVNIEPYIQTATIGFRLARNLNILLSPNGDEELIAGSGCATVNILWNTCRLGNNVLLEYSTNDGIDWNVIDTVSNSGSYQWAVPQVDSHQCLIKISDANNANLFDVSDSPFTILRLIADLNGDCTVDLFDFTLFCTQWLKGNPIQ